MTEAESLDPDRLLTSDISRPRTSSAKKLLELARQGQISIQAGSQPNPPEESLPGKGMPISGIPESSIPKEGIPLKGIPKRSIPKKGIPQSGIAESLLLDERITVLNNYTKFDNDISDKLARLQSLGEQAVYNRMYRLSWGYRRRTCRIGLGALAKAIGMSRSAAQRNLDSLIQKGHIIAYDDWNQEGRLYRILLPHELNLDSKTLVGPPPPSETEQGHNGSESSVPSEGIPESGIPESTYTQNEHTGIPDSGIPDLVHNKEKGFLKIERNSLSLIPSLVTEFYRSIGQPRLSKQKRERGEQICQTLLQDGFSIEDIRTACTWAIKHVPDVHSFSIIPEIIGQATAEQEQVRAKEQHEEQQRCDEELKRQQQAVEQRRREQAVEQREALSKLERQALRKQAEARIPDATKQVVDPQSAAYAKMIDAHELDILIGQLQTVE